ncbi:hypothetical protein QCM77_45625 [Bradyrhizobium sp. SSUT18]|uniref:hypothetical protein n=1 Tax=Bradyrhizobium sp. SSUT18 TaxID=3040602 RepID=UPI002446B968|nr:hypothetical protein [Bradyrhizobium sp. SSUT18]MDH2407041.1 hypothetical protein [Bradyrhizobium sp. SSUT18]
MPRSMSVWPVAIQTVTPLGIGIIAASEAQAPLRCLGVNIPVNPNATATAKLNLDCSDSCALRWLSGDAVLAV